MVLAVMRDSAHANRGREKPRRSYPAHGCAADPTFPRHVEEISRLPRVLPERYPPRVKFVYASSLTILCAFLGGGVSAWSERGERDTTFSPATPEKSRLEDRWEASWHTSLTSAARASAESGRPILVYTRLDLPFLHAFERAAGEDPVLAQVVRNFIPLALDVRGDGALDARALGLHSAPLFVRADPDADGSFRVTRAAETHTGALFEPIGLADEIRRLATHGSNSSSGVFAKIRQLDALGRYDEASALFESALEEERAPNGPLHRMALLRASVLSHEVTDVVDARGAIQEHLEIESEKRVLFQGWTTLASSYAAYRATREPGTAEGARDRLLRRMLDATRLGYKYAPDRVLAPYAALLLQRYAVDVDELDTMDKMFARAVSRTLRKTAPDSPRIDLTAPFERR